MLNNQSLMKTAFEYSKLGLSFLSMVMDEGQTGFKCRINVREINVLFSVHYMSSVSVPYHDQNLMMV